jgi:hypothetical protein
MDNCINFEFSSGRHDTDIAYKTGKYDDKEYYSLLNRSVKDKVNNLLTKSNGNIKRNKAICLAGMNRLNRMNKMYNLGKLAK